MSVLTTPIQINIQKPGFFKRRYEFFNNDRLLATLKFKSSWNYRAVFSLGDKTWQVRSCGFWTKSLEIIADQSPFTKTRLEYSGWKCNLRYKDSKGNAYIFKRTGAWKSKWMWLDENTGKLYMEMKSKHFSRSSRGYVLLYEQGPEETYIMMLMGWYLMMVFEANTAVAASASAA